MLDLRLRMLDLWLRVLNLRPYLLVWRRAGLILVIWSSHRRCFLPSLLSGSRRFLSRLLFEVLAHYLVLGLVTVTLSAQLVLLLHLVRISFSGIFSLVDRQRGPRRDRAASPPVPSAVALFPVMAPMLTPARRSIGLPALEVHGRLPVIADRYAQDEQWHIFWLNRPPGAVVPGAGIPAVTLVDPVHSVVKKVVGFHAWSVVDRIARHRDQMREKRQIYPDVHIRQADADADFGFGISHRPQKYQQPNQSAEYSLHFVLPVLFVGPAES